MKARTSGIRAWLFLSAVFTLPLLTRTGAEAATVTFDDLSPSLGSIPIPSGYAGLQWYYFSVFDGSKRPETEGYRTGLVSSNNVTFNPGGNMAMIWSMTNSFDLHSAYLTAAFIEGVQIRVQGFTGPAIRYDNTYTLHTGAPTLIQFDYPGVSQVRFIPSPATPFVMDNLEVTVHRIPVTHVPLDVGLVQASTIGHTFTLDERPIGNDIRRNYVNDFLVDQDQSSGGGGVLQSVSVDWNTKDQCVLTVSAPPGMKFRIGPPAGKVVRFGGSLWWESSRDGFSPQGDVAVSFGGLEGTPPGFAGSKSALSDSHGFFAFVNIESTGFTNEFSFTSMTMIGTMLPQHTGFGTLNFVPRHSSQLSVGYTTQQTNDPGSFVSIVPQPPPPRIAVWDMWADTGIGLFVQGQAGRTVVVESSADLIHWNPISTNVMSFTVCPVCPFVIVRDEAERYTVCRFYRAFEMP